MKLHMQILIALGLGIKRNWHIFSGIILGILVGIFLHSHEYPLVSTLLTFIGQVFIRLIQMVVIPLVVSAIIIGITSVRRTGFCYKSPYIISGTVGQTRQTPRVFAKA